MRKLKKILTIAFITAMAIGGAGTSKALAKVMAGDMAPSVTLTDSHGKTHSFEDFKGKIVVLEWNEKKCPFVKKFYKNGDMQKFQKAATDKGVIWLTINSSSKEHGGLTAEEANDMIKEKGIHSTAYIIDTDGTIGKAFGAKTTPHMFVLDTEGKVAYQGAIDSDASADADDIAGATNYVMTAIDHLMAGKALETTETQPYGCSVKY